MLAAASIGVTHDRYIIIDLDWRIECTHVRTSIYYYGCVHLPIRMSVCYSHKYVYETAVWQPVTRVWAVKVAPAVKLLTTPAHNNARATCTDARVGGPPDAHTCALYTPLGALSTRAPSGVTLTDSGDSGDDMSPAMSPVVDVSTTTTCTPRRCVGRLRNVADV